MSKLICALLASLWMASVFAAAPRHAAANKAVARAKISVPDSQQMELDLQHLSWPQFRSVIEAVPKMKAEVEAYGSIGWKYVESRYATYAWKKNIDKLDDAQKKKLADLIRSAKNTK
jgi:hypothetical protein